MGSVLQQMGCCDSVADAHLLQILPENAQPYPTSLAPWCLSSPPFLAGCNAVLPQDNAAQLGIGEYSLSQISLEQIFNGFASQQQEEQGRAAGIM